MFEPSPSVPLRTVESPMIHNVGRAGFEGTGGKYLPPPGTPFGAGGVPICVLRGTSLILTSAPNPSLSPSRAGAAVIGKAIAANARTSLWI